ncbi:MAG: hypothetical protein JNJ88_20130 [Planctomycetes bacterium]|nr:hypothetical protein [Planctomycetota bacterium]
MRLTPDRFVGSAHAPNHGAGLAPRDDEPSNAGFVIRARKRARIVAGDARALRQILHVRLRMVCTHFDP